MEKSAVLEGKHKPGGTSVQWLDVKICWNGGRKHPVCWLPGEYELRLTLQCEVVRRWRARAWYEAEFVIMYIQDNPFLLLPEAQMPHVRTNLYRVVALALGMDTQVRRDVMSRAVPRDLFLP